MGLSAKERKGVLQVVSIHPVAGGRGEGRTHLHLNLGLSLELLHRPARGPRGKQPLSQRGLVARAPRRWPAHLSMRCRYMDRSSPPALPRRRKLRSKDVYDSMGTEPGPGTVQHLYPGKGRGFLGGCLTSAELLSTTVWLGVTASEWIGNSWVVWKETASCEHQRSFPLAGLRLA